MTITWNTRHAYVLIRISSPKAQLKWPFLKHSIQNISIKYPSYRQYFNSCCYKPYDFRSYVSEAIVNYKNDS